MSAFCIELSSNRAAEASEPRIDTLFDRFLAPFNEATRRFGESFPYRYLRAAILASIGDGLIEMVVARDDGCLLRRTCAIENGDLVRTRERTRPIRSTWWVPQRVFDGALARPSVYLAHPEQFELAWFTARSATSKTSRL